MYQPPLGGWFLVGRCSVPINLIMPNGVPPFPATITRVALHGVDKTVLNFLHDTYMVGQPVLRPRNTPWIVPIKEN